MPHWFSVADFREARPAGGNFLCLPGISDRSLLAHLAEAHGGERTRLLSLVGNENSQAGEVVNMLGFAVKPAEK
jgi:hypothetical protein